MAEPAESVIAVDGTDIDTFRLQLLGAPRLWRESAGGSLELSWRMRRALAVVARLALARGQGVAKNELVEQLWPGRSPNHVRRNFHPTLSDARRMLGAERGSGVVYRHGTYALDSRFRWNIDIDEFHGLLDGTREALDETSLEPLQRAWKLYIGPLLDGFDEAWIVPYRELLHDRYVRMLKSLGDLASTLDRDVLAQDSYRTLLLVEPYEETAHVALMELYGRRRRRDLVRRQFVKLQELLKELAVEPADSTVERYHQLMG